MELVKELQRQWAVIAAAWPSLLTLAAALVLATWALVGWLYRHQVGTLKERIGLKDDTIADYKRKLDGATPDEARERLDALEKLIAHLQPREISGPQEAIIRKCLHKFPGGSVRIGYSQGDPICQGFANELERVFMAEGWSVSMTALVTSWPRKFPGLALVCRPGDDSPVTLAMQSALAEARIAFVRVENKIGENDAFRLSIGPMSP